jgi:ubiquinone/menaquinone biosynthesis C-methylase UbiE
MRLETKKKLAQIVQNNYEAQAADFAASRQKLFWPEMVKLTAEVESGARVLDLGCGQGRLLECFRDRPVFL